MAQTTANPTAVESATITFVGADYFLAQFAADSVIARGTPDAMLPGNPYGQLQVNSTITGLRSGTNQTDVTGRPIITRVSFTNPLANATLPPNVRSANLAANVRHACGQYTVTAADVTATASTIITPLTLNAVNLQIIRSGKVATADATIGTSGNSITVASGSTYTLTANDVINWFAGGV